MWAVLMKEKLTYEIRPGKWGVPQNALRLEFISVPLDI